MSQFDTYPLSERVKNATEEHHCKPLLLICRHTVASPASATVVVSTPLVVIGQHLENIKRTLRNINLY